MDKTIRRVTDLKEQRMETYRYWRSRPADERLTNDVAREICLREGAKAGTFVEIKNSDIGAGSKVPHLSYIGDTDIGEASNIGAGTITANYDGYRKHRTTIGSRVKLSVDTALIAPVSIGDDAYTAAGSVIGEDVPAGALGVARSRQENVEGYAERRKQREAERAADAEGPA